MLYFLVLQQNIIIVFFLGSAAGHELVFVFAEQLQNCPELCMAPH
jgi:hypothetical protein